MVKMCLQDATCLFDTLFEAVETMGKNKKRFSLMNKAVPPVQFCFGRERFLSFVDVEICARMCILHH